MALFSLMGKKGDKEETSVRPSNDTSIVVKPGREDGRGVMRWRERDKRSREEILSSNMSASANQQALNAF